MDILLTFFDPATPPTPLTAVMVILEYNDGSRELTEGQYCGDSWRAAQYNMSSGYIEMIDLERDSKILGWCELPLLKNLNLNFN